MSLFVKKMKKWVVLAKAADFNGIAKKFGVDPVIARLMRNRDVVGDEAIDIYLNGGLENLHDEMLMKDMQQAVEIILLKIRMGSKIRIIGDYDIDGVMSTYILHRGLKELGARVDFAIPNRITDGYGINQALIEQANQDEIDTIITCDNGIAARAQIQMAKEMGMTVIVTDHHLVPYEEAADGTKMMALPSADAVVNPHQEGCNYPFKELCGAGVAYKLIKALYHYSGKPATAHEELLTYVAIATIGDVMDLVGENRILVKEGMKRLQHTDNLGLQELIKVNGLEDGQISSYHIGFVLGPCLNASGRLDTAVRAIKLLNAQDCAEATQLAGDLKALNESRKEMTQQGVEEAVQLVESTSLQQDRVLVVYLPECHESLAGIIAGRLRERYGKPAFVLTKTDQGVKGSGRSIEAYSMYEELTQCKELLSKFGGHPMAAGLSLAEIDVPIFRKKLNEQCRLNEEDLAEKLVIDVAMPIQYITKALVVQLELLQPFGKGNTKPVFAQRQVKVINARVFGKNNNVVKMKVADEQGFSMDAVYFGESEDLMQRISQQPQLKVVYYPSINQYQGRETLQLVISDYQ